MTEENELTYEDIIDAMKIIARGSGYDAKRTRRILDERGVDWRED